MSSWRGPRGPPAGVWAPFAATLVNRLGTMALPFLVLYLTRSLGFKAARAGFVLTVYGLTAIVAGPLAGRLCGMLFTLDTVPSILVEVPLNLAIAKWLHRRALALGSFLIGTGLGALAPARGTLGVAGTVVVRTFGEMILLPGRSAYAADIAPPERRGACMGLY